jgi:hypothetical protein
MYSVAETIGYGKEMMGYLAPFLCAALQYHRALHARA